MALLLRYAGFLACTGPTVDEPVSPEASRLTPLSGPLLARRMSLDLRGVLPSSDEYDASEADAAAVDGLRETWLEDPRFEERLVSLLAERFQTRKDVFETLSSDYRLDASEDFDFVRSVGEEPLRLMAHVAVEDLPWTDIVTTDYTVANERLAELWNLEYPEGATGWQVARYTDGRPPGGILATNGLWWRYVTNVSNKNRARAAAISKLLLCEDYLDRPVTFSQAASLTDENGTAEAIRTIPACVGCHSSLDPLASSVFGFYTLISYNRDEMQNYHPSREDMGVEMLGVAPGYYGTPIGGLADLGASIAADPRFTRCAARTMAEALWRRPVATADFDRVETIRQGFIAGGLTMRTLIREILASDVYLAGSLGADAIPEDEEEPTVRLLSADQLASVVEDLTGFRWTYLNYEMLANDGVGFRVLAGGVDGSSVAEPQREPGLTWAVVVKRLAEGAAAYAVDRELVESAPDRRLFGAVTLESRPGDGAFDAELAALHWRMYGTRADEARITSAVELWSAIEAESGAAEAWKGLVSGMLRDPELVGY